MSRPMLVVVIWTWTVFQFSLAVAGCGGIGAFFSHPARAALAATSVVMLVVALFSPANVSPGEREDRANRWVLAAFGTLAILFAFLPAFTERRGIWTFGGDGVRWVGVALYAAGGALRIGPVFALGRQFSGLVAIQPGHTLVTGGVYAVVRNPSYLGMLVLGLGWALTFRSVVGVLITALIVLPLVARIRAEERLLRSQFGAEYEAYCARTWRLLPLIY